MRRCFHVAEVWDRLRSGRGLEFALNAHFNNRHQENENDQLQANDNGSDEELGSHILSGNHKQKKDTDDGKQHAADGEELCSGILGECPCIGRQHGGRIEEALFAAKAGGSLTIAFSGKQSQSGRDEQKGTTKKLSDEHGLSSLNIKIESYTYYGFFM